MDAFAGSRLLGFCGAGPTSRLRDERVRVVALAICAMIPVLSALYPKIHFARGRDPLFIRPEDPVVLLLLLLTLARGRWRPTGIDLRVVLFVVTCAMSILAGFATGTMQRPAYGLLYLFRMIEYFAIGYVVLNLIDRVSEIRVLLRVLLYAVVAVSLFGIFEITAPYAYGAYSPEFMYRAYERGLYHRDANHVAAFLVLGAAMSLGLAVRLPDLRTRMALLAVGVAAVAAVAVTYSRGAYIATVIAALVVVLLSPHRIRVLAGLAAVGAVAVMVAPGDMIRRVESIAMAWLGEDHTMSVRMAHYQIALRTFQAHPLLGVGLAAEPRVFYENGYMMLLAETGILGFATFGLILAALAWAAIDLYRNSTEPWLRGFATGYLAGLAGMLVLGCTLVVFVLSRVAPTFWVLSGILLWLRTTRGSPEASA